MNEKKRLLIIPSVLLAAMFLIPTHGVGASPVDPKQEAALTPEVDPAMAIVKRMAGYLSEAKGFSVAVDMGFDAVQESEQKIEFGETRKIVLARPDRLRVDAVKRSGEKSQLTFDGKNLSLYYEKPNVYSSAAKAGTVDQILKYFTEDLELRLPLAEMLSTQFAVTLAGKVQKADYVEASSIDGVACDHVALRGEDVDAQLWIAQGAKPLPQRVVIIYKDQEGEPRFWAQFRDWKLAPRTSKTFFAFKPPQDAKKVAFSPNEGIKPEIADAKEEVKPEIADAKEEVKP
jgi:hypothetical protein